MTENRIKNNNYLHRLLEAVVVFDGAMGTGLQKLRLSKEAFGDDRRVGCFDYLVVSCPEAVKGVHKSFLEVGVDVIETNTFRSNAFTLAEFGLEDQVLQINSTAARLAKDLAEEYSTPEKPRFVAGSLGPSGFLPSSGDPHLGSQDFDNLAAAFREQGRGLITGGADLLLIETSQDILEVKAAVEGCLTAMEAEGKKLPLQVQVTLDTTGRMLLGTDIETVLAVLEDLPVDIIGLNCSTGPEHMRRPVEYLSRYSSKPISAIPNAGMPVNRGGEAFYPMEPEDFADGLEDFVKNLGVQVIGGCCGTTPEHLSAVLRRVQGMKPKPRTIPPRRDLLASGIKTVSLRQEPAPLIIGERCNPQGSSLFKKILLEEKDREASETARRQEEQGAHALDLATALSENRDEAGRMVRLIRRFTADGIEAPLIIDTTEPEVMLRALKAAPGRCMLNSTHLESGEEKARKVFAMAKRYNAAVMLLTIDEEGMAKTVERKLTIARRLYRMAVEEYGLSPGSLVFDLLTFSLATGQEEYNDSAVATLEALKALKREFPAVYTSLGVSNVSFGFGKTARRVLNSVFLYHSVQAGLDMAIVNAAGITPYGELEEASRRVAEDLLLHRRTDALDRFVEFFETRQEKEIDSAAVRETLTDPAAVLAENILKRRGSRLKETVEALIGPLRGNEASEKAIETINTVLLPTMKEVGDRFGRGEIILPFVLQSAEVMKETVDLLEGYLEKGSGPSRGTVVLATVAGDVHDIGKNLVGTILSNNGYTVVDLGKQVPVETLVDEIEKNGADALGLSALLVSTSLQMGLAVKELARRKIYLPVLVGGAAINEAFAREISLLDDGSCYSGGVYYCRDAFEGLSRLNSLGADQGDPRNPAGASVKQKMSVGKAPLPRKPSGTPAASPSHPVPRPPFLGYRRPELPVQGVVDLINRKQLFLLHWGASSAEKSLRPGILADMEEQFKRMTEESLEKGYIHPQGLYGFFPVVSDGDSLLVLSSENTTGADVLERFYLPPEREGGPSAAAGFRQKDASEYDIGLFQVVTAGGEALRRLEDLQKQHKYTEAYYFHGFAAQAAEAAAQYIYTLATEQLKVDKKTVRRISWGYPAAPDLSEHEKLFRLLPAAKELGMSLTSAGQLVPEFSTAAMMVYKPSNKGASHAD
ncbi:MAG: homocysteine S-methyltransferase family protein [Spirochaetales bacterium]|nr:homocysteine S-methyltransferase family protein [Spirochaetales bacterium]